MKARFASALVVALAAVKLAYATEPNETFNSATVLSPGALSVSDELTAGVAGDLPDTLIGIRDLFGEVYFDAPGASGVGGAPTNYPGAIDFSITGLDDDDFNGSHSESGQYEVFVQVFDSNDDHIESFSRVRTLLPGEVHNFMFDDFEWFNGYYNVFVDDPGGAVPSDIDFFTFTGLTPGTSFTARTADPAMNGIDTLLGWFDNAGSLIRSNDDENFDGGIYTSRIEDTVPASGTLTFAVTGFEDEGFIGEHLEVGSYELRLQLATVGLAGDYNGNNVVDAADYVLYRNTLGQSGTGLAADGNNNNQIDPGDYTVWRTNFGRTAGSAATAGLSSSAIPEPTSLALVAILAAASIFTRRCRTACIDPAPGILHPASSQHR